jgi:glycosyltransferase involved in cell wall biosynthesis
MELYQSRGFVHQSQHVFPGLLTADWQSTSESDETAASASSRPYFACAGRLVTEKGFQTLIPLMRRFPDMDLRIAGSGPERVSLERLATGLPNVRFEGLLDHDGIRMLFRGARAIIVPSLFPETFGMVAAEAMSLGIPVIARNRGALPELLTATSGGLLFDREDQLAAHMRRIESDDGFAKRIGRAGSTQIPSVWRDEDHVEAYLELYKKFHREGMRA